MSLDEGEQIRDTVEAILKSIVAIDDELGDLVEFGRMVDHLAAPDRQRIRTVREAELLQLTSAVRTLQAAWLQRFGDDELGEFDDDDVFRPIQLAEGRIADPAVFARSWPLRADGSLPDAPTGAPALAVGTTGAALEADTDVAIARLPGGGDQPAVTLSLIKEPLDRWRVDIPDSLTAAMLISSLRQHVDEARRQAERWPFDRTAAHRHIASHLLAGLYDLKQSR